MREQREKDSFFETGFSLAIADGRHRRFYTRKLATSVQSGTKRVSPPICKTVITAPGSEVLMDQELLKLSSYTNVLSRLLL